MKKKKLLILLTLPLAFVLFAFAGANTAQAPVITEQSDIFTQREDCLFYCRDVFLGQPFSDMENSEARDPDLHAGYGGYDQGQAYSRCVLKCENRYWKKYDREMDELDDL